MEAPFDDKLEALLDKIRLLEFELEQEMQKKQKQFLYEVKRKRVRFRREIAEQHRRLVQKFWRYWHEAAWGNILTAPVIWSCLFPALFMDAVVSFYQAVCFPVYGIPKVRRSDYIVIDRGYLKYLNSVERINCMYCGYFNGLLAFVREVAARTEQYWCPIKHARKVKAIHSRYKFFLDYGDAEGYRKRLEKIRRDFEDLAAG